jgi:hypothetical protein
LPSLWIPAKNQSQHHAGKSNSALLWWMSTYMRGLLAMEKLVVETGITQEKQQLAISSPLFLCLQCAYIGTQQRDEGGGCANYSDDACTQTHSLGKFVANLPSRG